MKLSGCNDFRNVFHKLYMEPEISSELFQAWKKHSSLCYDCVNLFEKAKQQQHHGERLMRLLSASPDAMQKLKARVSWRKKVSAMATILSLLLALLVQHTCIENSNSLHCNTSLRIANGDDSLQHKHNSDNSYEWATIQSQRQSHHLYEASHCSSSIYSQIFFDPRQTFTLANLYQYFWVTQVKLDKCLKLFYFCVYTAPVISKGSHSGVSKISDSWRIEAIPNH